MPPLGEAAVGRQVELAMDVQDATLRDQGLAVVEAPAAVLDEADRDEHAAGSVRQRLKLWCILRSGETRQIGLGEIIRERQLGKDEEVDATCPRLPDRLEMQDEVCRDVARPAFDLRRADDEAGHVAQGCHSGATQSVEPGTHKRQRRRRSRDMATAHIRRERRLWVPARPCGLPRNDSASHQPLCLQESARDLLNALLVDVDRGVELRHGGVVELCRQRVQDLGELRVLVQDLLPDHGRHGVVREEPFVVLEDDEVEGRHAPVGREDEADVDLRVAHRLVDEAGVHADHVLARKLEAIGFLERLQPVGAGVELGVAAELLLLSALLLGGEVGQALDPLLGGILGPHRKGVGVVRLRGIEPDEALRGVELLDLGIGRAGVELVRHLVEVDERGAGVFPIDVDLAGFLRLAQRRRAEPGALVDREALGLEQLARHLGHDLLLGEVLAADDDVLGRRRGGAERERRPGEERDESLAKHGSLPVLMLHRSGFTPRGTNQYCAVPTAKSVSTASIAVGIAPASSMPGSLTSMPVKISSPRPPPPIRKASGAVPTLIASAVRMPARITKAAFGTSTFRRISKRVMPMPRAASIRCGGTLSMPATVLSTIGSSVRTKRPKMTGGRPSPSTVMAMARIASVGTVVPRLTTWVMALA